jgi:hypothetical protein
VIDLGLMETEFQGQRKLVNKLRLVFESEQKLEDGRNCIVSKNFTASLHPKAKLAEFLGKWRGRPVVPGETIDLGKLIGACCTLVISHQQNMMGQTYAAIDAISKPTKRLTPSGFYDPAAARQRIEEWKARQGANGESRGPRAAAPAARPAPPAPAMPPKSGAASQAAQNGGWPQQPSPSLRPPSPAPAGEGKIPNSEYDPEVGF